MFIQGASCDDLRLLSIDEIKQLLSNMFDGWTVDSDEDMINKLIECLDSETVQSLVQEPGFSVSDFDREFSGAEWRDLKDIFRSKGVEAKIA